MDRLGFYPFGAGLSEPRLSVVCAICRRPVNGHNMKDLCTCQPYMAPAGTVPPRPPPEEPMSDYRIVPVEPTEEMVRQAAAALANAAAPRSRFDPPAHARLAYAAMLSAAPRC